MDAAKFEFTSRQIAVRTKWMIGRSVLRILLHLTEEDASQSVCDVETILEGMNVLFDALRRHHVKFFMIYNVEFPLLDIGFAKRIGAFFETKRDVFAEYSLGTGVVYCECSDVFCKLFMTFFKPTGPIKMGTDLDIMKAHAKTESRRMLHETLL